MRRRKRLETETFRLAGCEGKEVFETPDLARTAAKRKRHRVAYHCSFCRHWHVGNLARKSTAEAPERMTKAKLMELVNG